MAVIRVNKTADFTVMSNMHFKEREMSLKAKGLLSLMLSLPDNWDYSISGLAAICKESETAIKSTLSELKKFGYLAITKKFPNETGTGRIEYIYNIYEHPQKQEGEKQGVENQPLEIQALEKQGVENQALENQGQLNTNQLTTKKENTYKLNTDDVVTAAADYNEENTLKFFKGSVVMFTDAQLDDLLSKMDLEVFDEYVYRLENFITSNNCTIKNHYATILKWYNEDRGIVGG